MSNVIFVRDMGRHRIIRAEATRLPKENGDRDFSEDFDAPGLASDGAATRPFLSYRVKPGEQDLVRVKISINGTNVVDQTLSDPVSRTFNGVVEHGVIKSEDNELRVCAGGSSWFGGGFGADLGLQRRRGDQSAGSRRPSA